MTTNLTPQIDQLKMVYIKSREKLLPETEALQINLTETFWETLKGKIKHGELINMAVRGEVRTGKSTIVIKIAYEINKYLHKTGKQHRTPNEIMNKHIFSDQTEFLRFINGNERNMAIVIDEFNTMAKTGLNATTEEALFEYYSDVFAGQYIHRITASPSIITDKNANIILDVIGKNETQQTTRCKLIYRDVATNQRLVIGYVDIYIGDITQTWQKKIKELIETKEEITPKQQGFIEKMSKEDFYVKYQPKTLLNRPDNAKLLLKNLKKVILKQK